jgi:hypothetical protein
MTWNVLNSILNSLSNHRGHLFPLEQRKKSQDNMWLTLFAHPHLLKLLMERPHLFHVFRKHQGLKAASTISLFENRTEMELLRFLKNKKRRPLSTPIISLGEYFTAGGTEISLNFPITNPIPTLDLGLLTAVWEQIIQLPDLQPLPVPNTVTMGGDLILETPTYAMNITKTPVPVTVSNSRKRKIPEITDYARSTTIVTDQMENLMLQPQRARQKVENPAEILPTFLIEDTPVTIETNNRSPELSLDHLLRATGTEDLFKNPFEPFLDMLILDSPNRDSTDQTEEMTDFLADLTDLELGAWFV